MKNKNKLKLLLITCCCLCYFYSFSQTYIGVSLGRDYAHTKAAKNVNVRNIIHFKISDKGYSIKSFSYGIELEQVVSDRISISLQSSFTHKDVNAFIFNYIPFVEINFDYYRHSLLVNTTVKEHWILGGGGSFGMLTNINRVLKDREENIPYLGNKKEAGALAYVGYRYKGLSVKLSYYGGLKLFSPERNTNKITPIQSINISVNYRLKILNKIRIGGRKVGCPAMD